MPATVTPRQVAGWVQVSSDPECEALAPGPVPSQLSWAAPETCQTDPSSGNVVCSNYCDGVEVDGEGDLAVNAAAFPTDSSNPSTLFFRPDGSGIAVMADSTRSLLITGPVEYGPVTTPRPSGFLLFSSAYCPQCNFLRLASADGTLSAPAVMPTGMLSVTPNPKGGFVEAAFTSQPFVGGTLWLRWVDGALQPLGDWHEVMTSYSPLNNDVWVSVDQQGNALVLSFQYPPAFGPPADPSTWIFTARWLGPQGPLSDAFEPAAPIFTPSTRSGVTLSAGWGWILPLAEGGFAMYVYQADANSGGTISPVGWYAAYASGQAGANAAPNWLGPYNGTLKLVAGGAAYAAIQRDPDTCARTALLIAKSGRTCFKLTLADSNAWCNEGIGDYIWPDGTLVLQNNCQLRWWPGLVRLKN